jgi:hypothetical protein
VDHPDGGADRLRSPGGERVNMSAERARAHIQSLIDAAFQQSSEEYAAEIAEARRRTGMAFAEHRPVFIMGDPVDVARGQYLLFVSLNPKLDEPGPATAHYADLDRDAASNASVTLGYFQNIPSLHPYFTNRARFVREFAAARGQRCDRENRALLRANFIGIDSVPYHSGKTDRPMDGLGDLANVVRAREALRGLLDLWPPAAIVLDGKSSPRPLAFDAPVPETALNARVGRKKRRCLVEIGTHQRIPMLRCGFIGQQSGLSSNEQIAEAVQLLARATRAEAPVA